MIFFAMTTVQAQEKGFYLTLDGGLGWTNLGYDLNGGSTKGGLGYGGGIGAQYFFNRHWGVSLSGEIFVFNTQSLFSDKSFTFQNQIDDEGDIYDLKIRLRDWKESQTTTFLEIPLMLMYQHKFGKKEMHGLYFGIGPKVQIPINSTYKTEGLITNSALYHDWELPFEEGSSSDLPQHGYSTNKDRPFSGDNELKTGFAIAGEIGALFGLSRRVDLTLGVMADYGLTDIKNKNEDLLGPTGGQQTSVVAENVFYNGVLNSNQADKINTMSVRGKIGLRIKLGKLKERPVEEEKDEQVQIPLRDTIIVNPVVIQVPTPVVTPIPTVPTQEPAKVLDLPKQVEDELEECIYFDLNKYDLRKESIEVLDRKVELMRKYPNASLSVIGHTCDLGNNPLNDKLAFNRAEAARYYLIRKGIKASRITTIAKGKDDPAVPNTTEKNRELNRMVEFILTK